jgi:hypothetical protein
MATNGPFDFAEARSTSAGGERTELLLSAWLERDIPPRTFLLGNLLCTTSRWLAFGATGVGKTLFFLDLAGAVAAGCGFLNWKGSGGPKRVMYLDGELPSETFKERMQLLASRYGASLELFGYNRDALGDDEMPPLNIPEGEKWLWREIDRNNPDLIVFDSIMCLLSGNMSEEDSWAYVKGVIRRVTARRIAQIWLHHTGHDASKGFGTKTREWEMDTVIGLFQDPDEKEHIQIEFKKNRLKTPSTAEQFASLKISYTPGGWAVVGEIIGERQKTGSLSPETLAIKHGIVDAYGRLADNVQPSHGLDGKPVRKVSLDTIREDLKRRDLLDLDEETGHLTSSGKSEWRRARLALTDTAKTHILLDGLFWKITP